MAIHNDFGNKGEQIAKDFLLKNSHEILATNYVFQRAEIDIISKLSNGIIVFTEVKTLASQKSGNPEDAVSKSKQNQIAKAALNYIEENNHHGEIRYDIIAVILYGNKEIKHFKDAFFPVGF
ncbi:MAG: YraN family protein [Chitinophagales bacterium]